ncbi:uncharacterized protein LOC112055874 [Bicyclus anynana]|uniref:Uncharacterized protein LOC112055874 n=1 Tax=Bicyclus anynana TaxID=110368 RepID=A0ABM3LFX0_BICAN|nr:uncharacterized protein LOC112055874 [Bicyclus anynana]
MAYRRAGDRPVPSAVESEGTEATEGNEQICNGTLLFDNNLDFNPYGDKKVNDKGSYNEINALRNQYTTRDKNWEYQEYYLGEKDKENRKCGEGEYHWSGAQSIESYDGHFIRDTMHGVGDYRWQYHGSENLDITYEGHFYCNKMHGYGTLSFPDGRTFYGLFLNDVRWGPGIQSHADAHEDVGLWRGNQLVRLAWRPEGPSIVPEFVSTNIGRTVVESHRILLCTEIEKVSTIAIVNCLFGPVVWWFRVIGRDMKFKAFFFRKMFSRLELGIWIYITNPKIGETNKAIELLKQSGADPLIAAEKWRKLYPSYCTDLDSPLCYTESFDRDYYKGKLYTLKEVEPGPEQNDRDSFDNENTYYAWNNNSTVINMMKHSYKHEKQRCDKRLDLKYILTGPRIQFKLAGNHELDCRTVLMAAFLGHIDVVAQLVNDNHVNPDVADVRGNSAVMYATVGDKPDTVHFLVEAGANVDSYNDSCCTPLGVALMQYICIVHDIPPSEMLKALLPAAIDQVKGPVELTVIEWNMTREHLSGISSALTKSPSKSNRIMSSKKIKSFLSIKDQPGTRKKTEIIQSTVPEDVLKSDDLFSENKKLYESIAREYSTTVSDVNLLSTEAGPVQFILNVIDMVKEVDMDTFDDEPKKVTDKSVKKSQSNKILRDIRKTSKEIMWQNIENEEISITKTDILKSNNFCNYCRLQRAMSTILQLLSDGANPKLVRCPHPALLLAVMSNSPDLIRHLVHYGANINEIYHQLYNYTPLDIAVSRSLSYDNLEIVRALLESGADAQHRLVHEQDLQGLTAEQIDGPTLLHAVLAKKTENEMEDDICHQLLALLLDYNCNPTALYKGCAALDVAMSKTDEIFNVFIKNPKINLNAVINNCNQSVLLKMFSFPYFKNITSVERLQRLTDLLLYGADPLLQCQNREEKFQNFFVFAKQTLNEVENSHSKAVNPPAGKISETKVSKKGDKSMKSNKSSMKQTGKGADDVEDYRQAIDLVTDCARLVYVRWVQAKIMKDLIVSIDKYKHRHWQIILKSCQDLKSAGLWLSPQRCLEIWDILSDTKKKVYKDQRIMTHLLSIVVFLSWQNYDRLNSDLAIASKITTPIKTAIDKDVGRLLKQYKSEKKFKLAFFQWQLSYVKPELDNDAKKYDVCFECILPLKGGKILCNWCKQVYFCSSECMSSNVLRSNCHPCSYYLKEKYFASPNESS